MLGATEHRLRRWLKPYRQVVLARCHNVSMNAWLPPGSTASERIALVEGIPDWVDEPVREWFARQVMTTNGRLSADFLRAWDIVMRNSPPAIDSYRGATPQTLWLRADQTTRVALLDFALYYTRDESNGQALRAQLEALLLAGGSEWKVGVRDGLIGLEKRVPQGVSDAAESIMTSSGSAGALLSEAWHAAFGRGPDAEEAYEKAIKAVEEAGASVVSPKNAKASLGTMARDMENQGNWSLPLGDDSKHPAISVAYMMVQSLWAGQESRHGGNGYRKPTQDEAEAAVLLAVPLVQWFTSGLLARR